MTQPDLSELTSWHSNWRDIDVVVIGLGATGFSVLDTLVELGARVSVIARDAKPDVLKIAALLGANLILEADDARRGEAGSRVPADVVVVSPGISPADPAVVALQARGVPVWSDTDFAWRVRDKYSPPASWIVVAGDRFGPQAADLASRIAQAEGRITAVAGWQGPPLLDLLRDPIEYQSIILNPSLESLRWWGSYPDSLREPLVSVLVEQEVPDYAAVVYEGTSLACVYWSGAGPTESFVEQADVVQGARAIGVGTSSPGMSEIGLVEDIVCDRAFLEDRKNQALEISTLEELSEGGIDISTQLPAIFAAVAIARALDIPPALIAGVLSLP